ERRQEVADARTPERGHPVAREARVVGDERRPRHGHRDDGVDAEPERAVMRTGMRPEATEIRAVHDPPGQVDDRREDGPARERAYETANESDWAEQREHRRGDAEHELPEPDRLEAEQLVAEEAGGGRDHDQLEDRPAEALHDVQHGGEVRAALTERRSLQHPRRDAT